jgi:hypothetical protein
MANSKFPSKSAQKKANKLNAQARELAFYNNLRTSKFDISAQSVKLELTLQTSTDSFAALTREQASRSRQGAALDA